MLMQVNVEAPSEHVYVCSSNGMSQYKTTLQIWMNRTCKVVLLHKFAVHSVQVWLREPSVSFVSKVLGKIYPTASVQTLYDGYSAQ